MAKHQTDTKKGHSKYYWEEGRNGYYCNTTLDGFTENIEVEINPKMLMSKEELGLKGLKTKKNDTFKKTIPSKILQIQYLPAPSKNLPKPACGSDQEKKKDYHAD